MFGHAFFDIGAAWDDLDEFDNQQMLNIKYRGNVTTPKISGFGIGLKLFTPLGLLRIDTAWDIKQGGGYSKPQFLFSFGPDW